MKWSVVMLLALGMVAALCASVLVGALRSGGGDSAQGDEVASEVTLVVASRDLEAGIIVEADAVSVRTIRSEDVPENALSDPVNVVGKVLGMPLVEGQAFLASGFAKTGSGLHLAAALPTGMRAVAISLSDSSALSGLLYPGCIVDVLATSKPRSREEPVSEVLLERVRVLGIEDQTIVSADDSKGRVGRSMRRREMVTLMLDIHQAEMLQVAVESGTVSLAMRHPLDSRPVELATDDIVEVDGPRDTVKTFTTWQINDKKREAVTYFKKGDTWLRRN